MENRITIEDLKHRYNVSERTLRTWKETKGLDHQEIFVKCGSFIDFEEDNEGKQILSIIEKL